MDQLLNTIFLLADAPMALFSALFLASVGNSFFPPIPIELGTVFAGYVVSAGHGSLFVIVAATTLGMSLGGIALYETARHCGIHYFNKTVFTKVMPATLYEKSSGLVHRYGIGSLFIAKCIPGMNFCVIVSAGLFRTGQAKTYAGIVASNSAVFGSLAYIGKAAGDNWRAAFKTFGEAGGIVAVIVIMTVGSIFVYRRFRRSKTI